MKLIVKEVSKGSLTLVPGGKGEEPEPQYDENPWEQPPDPSPEDLGVSPEPEPKKNHLKLVVKERKNS